MKHEINGIKSLLSDEWRVMQAATHGPDPVYIVQMSIELDGRDVATGDLHHLLSKKTVETICLLYTSPSPRDATLSRMPSSA